LVIDVLVQSENLTPEMVKLLGVELFHWVYVKVAPPMTMVGGVCWTVEVRVVVSVVVVVLVAPPRATNKLAEIKTPAMTIAAAMTR